MCVVLPQASQRVSSMHMMAAEELLTCSNSMRPPVCTFTLCAFVLCRTLSFGSKLCSLPPCLSSQEMQEHLRSQPALLQEILKSLFEVILFEENSNQWSLSRPRLSLILINEPMYMQVRQGEGTGVC